SCRSWTSPTARAPRSSPFAGGWCRRRWPSPAPGKGNAPDALGNLRPYQNLNYEFHDVRDGVVEHLQGAADQTCVGPLASRDLLLDLRHGRAHPGIGRASTKHLVDRLE